MNKEIEGGGGGSKCDKAGGHRVERHQTTPAFHWLDPSGGVPLLEDHVPSKMSVYYFQLLFTGASYQCRTPSPIMSRG